MGSKVHVYLDTMEMNLKANLAVAYPVQLLFQSFSKKTKKFLID